LLIPGFLCVSAVKYAGVLLKEERQVKYSVCLEPLFTDLPFPQRIARVAELGYEAIEFWFSDYLFTSDGLVAGMKDIDGMASAARDCGVEISDFAVNSNEGWFGGWTVKASDRQVFLDRLASQIEVAQRLSCKRLIICTGNRLEDSSYEVQFTNLVDALRAAAPLAAQAGITLIVEPLNTHVNHPGYFLETSRAGFEIVKLVDHPNVKLLYDIYHMQIMEGDLIATIRRNIGLIGHFHSAGNPGRNEHFIGEIHYPAILREIAALGYEGNFGLEYFPTLPPTESLRQVKAYLDTYKE
jgi:hydroxypyruvate isomerase